MECSAGFWGPLNAGVIRRIKLRCSERESDSDECTCAHHGKSDDLISCDLSKGVDLHK